MTSGKSEKMLRCELDAAFFHLYGIERDDLDYIMETFPIVKRKDEAAHGEYRTKRVVLEIYDQMARAAETGVPYRTPLDPPPVDLGTGRVGTVTPLRPRDERPAPMKPPEPRPEERQVVDRAAEERLTYVPQLPNASDHQPEGGANGAAEPTPREETRSPSDAPERLTRTEPDDAAHGGRATPEAPFLDVLLAHPGNGRLAHLHRLCDLLIHPARSLRTLVGFEQDAGVSEPASRGGACCDQAL